MTKIRLLVAALAVAILGTLGIAVSSAANAAGDVVVTATVLSNPDNSPHQVHWADTSFKRTMVIHNNGDGTNTVTTTDTGTFTTRKGEGSPNFNKPISRTLTGNYSSAGWGTITGELDPAYKDADGHVFDAKAGRKLNTAEWAQSFFKPGATGHPFSGHYSFDYQTADERWLETTETDQKNHPTAGDITGKFSSKLAVTALCSTKTTAKFRISNVQGDRVRQGKYSSHYPLGAKGWSKPVWSKDIAPKSYRDVIVAKGTSLSVHYYNGYGVLLKIYASTSKKAC